MKERDHLGVEVEEWDVVAEEEVEEEQEGMVTLLLSMRMEVGTSRVVIQGVQVKAAISAAVEEVVTMDL
ncbi:unnamed protein product [Rhodiola kirilowii]